MKLLRLWALLPLLPQRDPDRQRRGLRIMFFMLGVRMASNESLWATGRDIGWARAVGVGLIALTDSRGGIPHLSAARKNSRSAADMSPLDE